MIGSVDLDALFQGMGAGVYATDLQGRLVTINDEGLRLLGYRGEEIAGRPMHDLVHYQDRAGRPLPRESCALMTVMHTARAARGDDDTFWRADGSPLPVLWLSAPLIDPGGEVTGAVVVFADAAMREADAERIRELEENQLGMAERVALLGRVSDALATLDLAEAFRRLARLSVGRAADWCVVDTVESGSVRRVALGHREPESFPDVKYTRELAPLTEEATGSLAQALHTGIQQRLRRIDRPRAGSAALDAEEEALFAELGMAHALVTPVLARHEVLGAVTWVRVAEEEPFTDADAALATAVARRAGHAAANAHLFTQQRQVAESLQRSMLPVLPQPHHLYLAARYLPASEGAHIGGDWYDAFTVSDGATMLVIGDVTGHDLGAASQMGQMRNMLRGIAFDRREPPSAVLTRLDQAVVGLQADTLATCLIARVEQTSDARRPDVRQVWWTSAGHPSPVVVGADGSVRLLEEHGDLMLGVDADTDRHDALVELQPGEAMWLYTDGLVERPQESLEVGLGRLRRALAATARLPLEEACDQVLARLMPDEHADDVALLAVRVEGDHSGHLARHP